MNEKLPKILVVMLENILNDHALSSWQFKGGPLYTQLTIRFTQGDMADDIEDTKYRRISPSQQHRDKMRVQKFLNEKDHDTCQSKEYYKSENIHDSSMTTANSCEDALPAIDSLTVSNKTTADENVTDERVNESTIAAAADGGFSHPVETLVGQVDQYISTSHVNTATEQERGGIKDVCCTPDVNTGSKQQRGGIKDTDGKNNNSSDSDEEFSCDGCGCMMSGAPGTKWFRCTECGDLDICETCHHNNFHTEHKPHMSAFKCPKDLDDPYCDACWKMFDIDDSNAILHYCQICQDYVLCSVCKRKSFHNKHRQCFRTILVQEYIDL